MITVMVMIGLLFFVFTIFGVLFAIIESNSLTKPIGDRILKWIDKHPVTVIFLYLPISIGIGVYVYFKYLNRWNMK